VIVSSGRAARSWFSFPLISPTRRAASSGLQNLLREPAGDAEFGGNFLKRHRGFAALESLADATSSAAAR